MPLLSGVMVHFLGNIQAIYCSFSTHPFFLPFLHLLCYSLSLWSCWTWSQILKIQRSKFWAATFYPSADPTTLAWVWCCLYTCAHVHGYDIVCTRVHTADLTRWMRNEFLNSALITSRHGMLVCAYCCYLSIASYQMSVQLVVNESIGGLVWRTRNNCDGCCEQGRVSASLKFLQNWRENLS